MTATNTSPAGNPQGPARPHGHKRRRLIVALACLAVVVAGAIFLVTSHSSHSQASTLTNCAAVPSKCGFPDATNTGVPAGTALKTVGTGAGDVSSGPGWYYDPRGWVEVNGSGATVSGLNIPYNLNVAASNVTVKDDRIVTSGASSFGVTFRHTSGVTVENCTISGVDGGSGRLLAGLKDSYNDSTGLQVLNNNIYDVSAGVQIESGLIQGNYIHDMGLIAGDHLDGTNSDGGVTGLLTIQHNTIFDQYNQTTAVGLFEDFGVQSNRVVTDNLLAGGGYTIYAGQNNGGATTSKITITNNRISNLYFPQGGQYGPVTDFNTATTTWTGNVWDATGAPVPSP
jgi:hypothetical protein